MALRFEYEELSREFQQACRKAGLGHRVLYELRPGGASEDGAVGEDPVTIQRRGRWKQPSSVTRYLKPGLLQESWASLPQKTIEFCLLCAGAILEILEDSSLCPPLPWTHNATTALPSRPQVRDIADERRDLPVKEEGEEEARPAENG